MKLGLASCAFVLSLALGTSLAEADTALIAPVRDNSIYAESGTLSNAMGPGLFSGRTNDGFTRRALLEFDIAAAIPPGSTINSATLRMVVTQSNTGDLPIDLHRLSADWGEAMSLAPGNGGTGTAADMGDVTWTHSFYNAVTWATPGGDFNAMPSATAVVGAINSTATWTSAQLAADVQTFLDSPAQNHGWIVVATTANAGQAKRYGSRENPDAALKPVLEVDFLPSGVVGACCNPDGSCSTVLDPGAACMGTYEGLGTSCGTVSCPQPTGACCIADVNATCLDVTAADCATQGGMFQGAFVGCASDLCPVVPTPFLDPLPIPATAQPMTGSPGGAASYQIAMVQLDQVMHSELPATTVWGFDDGTNPPSMPGPTIEARSQQPIEMTWVNDLRNDQNQLLTSHHLPVDLCPNGAVDEARTVIHLHGGHIPADSDGYPMMSLLPGESTVYDYTNNQTNATLWYHDHTMGMTRLNVAMGLAGGYVLRDAAEDALALPSGAHEIPLIISDRSFNVDGSFKYPSAWTEHFFGNVAIVNGHVWPYLNVDRGKYRFRVVNGSGSRVYRLALSNGASFQQIGSDGGLLEAPVTLSQVLLMPGERADLIMDFASYPAGTVIDLKNDAPAPYPGTMSMEPLPDILRFVVQSTAGDTDPIPASLVPVNLPVEADAANVRDFVLQRETDPCAGAAWRINSLSFDDITEMPALGSTEIWRFVNRSGLAHPMHMHLVMFRVLDRQPFNVINNQVVVSGPAVPPIATEAGYKDTVRVEPNEIVRVVARFDDYVGMYPYHCHILEHEDHDMMRQFMTTTTCGDGAAGYPDELCDDGNFNLNDSCPDGSTGSCAPAFCGDGFLWNTDGGTEECDQGGEAQFCDDDCTQAACGDDNVNETAGEQCDDGNTVEGDGCSATCQDETPGTGGSGGGGAAGGGASAGGASTAGGGDAGGQGGGGTDVPPDGGCYCRTSPAESGAQGNGNAAGLGALGLLIGLATRRRQTRRAH